MAVTTFDTLKFVRRLEQVGVPSEQAEVQAEVLTEAFNVNLEELVTKNYLTAEFAKERAYLDTRFAEQLAYINTRFAEQNAYIDTRFEQVNVRFKEVMGNFRTLYWILGIIVAATVTPWLERLINL